MKEVEDGKTFIAQVLTRHLLNVINKVMAEHQNAIMDGLTSDYEFPILPGSHLTMDDPPLEFVKFLCAALASAKEYSLEMGILRRNLLELVGVREFADAATFRSPCEPFKLPMVICQGCEQVREFDFCRDPDLLPPLGAGSESQRERDRKWFCQTCDTEYDKIAIEFLLIEAIHKIQNSFCRQDFRCGKCKEMMAENLRKNCQCSSKWLLTVKKEPLVRQLKTIKTIAVFHGFERVRVSISSRVNMRSSNSKHLELF